MLVKDIIDAVEAFAPLSLQEGYDNSGLLVGGRFAEVNSALLCVDITEAVVDEALEVGAEMIISHHPVIFHPLKRLTGATYIERVVEKAIRNGLTLYASHTNLDSTSGGMSYTLARLLELDNVAVLREGDVMMCGTGYGVTGYLREEMSLVDFLKFVKERLRLDVVRYSETSGAVVKKVALCTGSGASLVSDARNAEADVYISSEFKYNDFLDASGGMVIADIGHFESEYCAIDLLFDIIRKKMPTFALHKSRQSVNPVKYLVENR